jgi:hypothetical protein
MGELEKCEARNVQKSKVHRVSNSFPKTEVSVRDSQTWLSVALGIPQNTKYLQKTLLEGTSTLWNTLEFTCSFAMTQSGFQAFSRVLPPSLSKYSIVV